MLNFLLVFVCTHVASKKLSRVERFVSNQSLVDQVDIFVGTGGHGHTFPGAATPWGLAIATPWAHSFSVSEDWDSQSGFNADQESLNFFGMAHSSLSGAGSGELGEVRLLPVYMERGMDQDRPATRNSLLTASCSASPGRFSGTVNSSGKEIFLVSSVTQRAAIHRFSFKEKGRRAVQLLLSPAPDSFWGYKLMDYQIHASSKSIEGCSLSMNTGIGGAESLLCFSMHFSATLSNSTNRSSTDHSPEILLELTEEDKDVTVRVGLSRTDIHHAKLNLQELGDRSLEEVAQDARQMWQEALGVVDAEMPAETGKVFYTAMYHSMLAPQLLSEADGSFRLQRKPKGSPSIGWEKGEAFTLADIDSMMPIRHNSKKDPMYHTFSLWDTYRGLHPFVNLIHPEMGRRFANTLVGFGNIWGFLPRFQLLQSPADMMAGDGGSIILATSAREGLVDRNRAFQVLNASRRMAVDERGILYKQGFIEERGEEHSVSKTLEQAMADSCVSRLAMDLGYEADASFFERRAKLVFKYWNKDEKVFAPMIQGSPENVPDVFNQADAYQEGTALQYSFSAHFDIDHMMALHGGKSQFVADLDNFFNKAPPPQGQADLRLSILHGFTMGNEPTMHIPFLYAYAGDPGKGQDIIDNLLQQFFKDGKDGLPGNDDFGALSAWAAFNILGFYPVDPCSAEFVLGRPFIDRAALKVEGGTFEIVVHHKSKHSIHFQKVTLNGQDVDLQRPILPFSALAQPGKLEIWMKPRMK